MKTAIMTDTNSGITKNIAEKLGIYVIHMPVIIDETTFYENDTITEAEFFHALSSDKHITTSQPSPGEVMDLWDQILNEGYDELVYIPMSSGLSNSCAAATGYSLDYQAKVEVIDNHRISITMYESVLHAREMSLNGASAKEIKTALESDLEKRFSHQDMSKLHIGVSGAGLTTAQQDEWLTLLRNKFPEADIFYSPLSASISVNTGSGSGGTFCMVYGS